MRFLLFRLPNENKFYCIKGQELGQNLASFFPFCDGEILHLHSDKVEQISKEEIYKILDNISLPIEKEKIKFPTEREYFAKIERTIQEIKTNQLQKLVISRPIYQRVEKWDLTQIFLKLTQKYPQTLCYLWKDQDKIWLGATPEILGKYNAQNSIFETMSLAGTLSKSQEWSDKEKEEQKAVTEYISNILKTHTDEIEISEVKDQILGEIKHLRTDFRAKIQKSDLESLIQKLHPTPAVCGFPTSFCKTKIKEIEAYPREYYTGYIKIAMPNDEVHFFVNLRCMQIFRNSAIRYVGGGITAKSNLKTEWQETEMKARMLRNIWKLK
ncbi:MAG: chorismate-binding protein [Flavobacteriaceae bacterium]|nr:chorismate-binding protein [Flavobacteriaceae bacterium]